jgi:molybdopterin synthase sulfur carrier subunit
MSNIIYIKAFGMVAEKMGKATMEIENPGNTEALKNQLLEQFPALKSMKFSLAVNKRMVSEDSELGPGAEVALLPPFSGG